MRNELPKDLLKISELAKATDTNITTLKYYIKEELIQAACKTTKNMAYYSPDCIQRVKLIRSLQKEHYYPLSVIKGLLENATDHFELEFMDAIHKADAKTSDKTYSLNEAIKLTGLSRVQIDHLRDVKIISCYQENNKIIYTYPMLQIMRLVKRRIDVNIPFEQSVKAFTIYQKALDMAAAEDVDSFITGALLASAPSAQQATKMIGISDDTLNTFASIKRNELNRKYGSNRIEQLHQYAKKLSIILDVISDALSNSSFKEYANVIKQAKQSLPTETNLLQCALKNYYQLINSATKSLGKSIMLIHESQSYFLSIDFNKGFDMEKFLVYTLKMGWFFLAPSLLEYGDTATKLMDNYQDYTLKSIGKSGLGMAKAIRTQMEYLK